jgi:hypothetical protein
MSVTYVTIADMRALEPSVNFNKRAGVIKTLLSSWIDNTVDPPFSESISGFFSVGVMNRTVHA